MKKNSHPETYRTILFYDTSVKEAWLIKSCAPTNKVMVWEGDGQEYPVFYLDSSAASHPFYTGKSNLNKSEGRVKEFRDRYKGVGINYFNDEKI